MTSVTVTEQVVSVTTTEEGATVQVTEQPVTVTVADVDISQAVIKTPQSAGRNTIQPSSDLVPLAVKGDAAQTENLFEAQDSDGAVLASIDENGVISGDAAGLTNLPLPMVLVAASDAPSVVQQIADQVCDGTDDQVEIQAAVDSLGAAGGTVLLSEGTFTTSATVRLVDNLTLVGQGMGATTIASESLPADDGSQSYTTNTQLRGWTVSNVVVADLTLTITDTEDLTEREIGLSFDVGCVNCRALRIEASGHQKSALRVLAGCDRIWFESCYVHDTFGTGTGILVNVLNRTGADMVVYNAARNVYILNNRVERIEPDSAQAGIAVWEAGDATVENVVIANNIVSDSVDGDFPGNGIKVYMSNNAAGGSRVAIVNNIVEGCANHGIEISGAGGTLDHILITGNVLEGNGGDAIALGVLDDASTWLITGNYGADDRVGTALARRGIQADDVPLTLKGVSGQTGDLSQWQDDAGTNLSRVDASGRFVLATVAGPPTGTPTIGTTVLDTDAEKLWIYTASGWLSTDLEAPSIVTDGLVAHYAFDEGSGQVLGDSTSNGLDGQLGTTSGTDASDPSWVTEGLSFDGGDTVEIADDPLWDVSTISLGAVFNTSSATLQGLIDRFGSGATIFQFRLDADGKIRWIINDGSTNTSFVTPTAWNDGDWHHVVATYDGSTVKIYVDGVERLSTAYAGGIRTGSQRVDLGSRHSIDSFLTGTLGYATYYDRALTASEVAQNDNALQGIMAERGVTLG